MDSLRRLLSQLIKSSLFQKSFLLPFWQTQTPNQTKTFPNKTQCTSSCQQKNNQHYHVLCSRIWYWLRFHHLQRCCSPSQCPTWNGLHPRFNTNLIWQYCRQLYNHWHSCTTQIQSYGHALSLASWLISDKKNIMVIGNKEKIILPTIHQNITPKNITFQFDLPM